MDNILFYYEKTQQMSEQHKGTSDDDTTVSMTQEVLESCGAKSVSDIQPSSQTTLTIISQHKTSETFINKFFPI